MAPFLQIRIHFTSAMIHTETDDGFPLAIPRCIGTYILGDVIGQGSSSAVIAAIDRSSGKEYAIKVMSATNLRDSRLLQKIERELDIVQTLNHDNIIQFREIIRDGDLICIVSEKCDGGDLFEMIRFGKLSDRSTLKRLFRQIAQAVQYLHWNGVAHNDIKAENVILDKHGNAKLIDFGFAKREPIAGDDDKSGTLVYVAPEMLLRGPYDTRKVDIWSLGILLSTMASGTFPYPPGSDARTAQLIIRGQLSHDPSVDRETDRLIRRMTRVDPMERPTIDMVLEDPFFDELMFAGMAKPSKNGSSHDFRIEVAETDLDGTIW
jgi:serine/threonine protein kinase